MKSGLTLTEMSAEVLRQSSLKEDYVADTRRMSLEPGESGVVLRMLDDAHADVAEPLDVNDTAHRQIATHTGVPQKYYDRLYKENPALLTYNVNSWFQTEPAYNRTDTHYRKTRRSNS